MGGRGKMIDRKKKTCCKETKKKVEGEKRGPREEKDEIPPQKS